MAYVHFEDVSEVLVSTELALRPDHLVSFLVSATLQQQNIQHHQHEQRARSQSMESVQAAERAANDHSVVVGGGDQVGGYASITDQERGEQKQQADIKPSVLTASREALSVARRAVRLLEAQVQQMERDGDNGDGAIVSPAEALSAGSGGNGAFLFQQPVRRDSGVVELQPLIPHAR